MHIPGVINRPKLIGWNEFLKAFQRWNVLVVALLDVGAHRSGIFSAEPVVGGAPAIGSFHADAVPELIPLSVLRERRNSVHHGVLPMQLRDNLVIFLPNGLRRAAVTGVGPYK